jgi:autotransporter translocation and assembly factor TamB
LLKAVDLQQLSGLWYPKHPITGVLSVASKISGTLARPVIQTDLKIENGAGYDFSFSEIECALNYRQAQVFFRASGVRKGTKILDINGKTGIGFSLVPFKIEPHPNRFEITAQADGIKLSALPIPKPAGVQFDGKMSLNVCAAGDLNAPEFKGKLSLKDGFFLFAGAPAEKVTFRNFDIGFDYRNSRAMVDAILFRQNRKALDINGQAGLQISLVPFRFIPLDKDLKLAVNAQNLKLSLLPLPKPAGLKLDGILNLKASASGGITRPVIAGSLTIRDGYLSIPGRPLSYEEMTADISFSPGNIAITKLQLKGDKEGYLTFEGVIETKGLKPSAFNIRMKGENVYIPYKSIAYARVQPDMTFSGIPKAPKLTGTLNVTESRIYIDQLTQTGPAEIQVDAGQPPDGKLILLDEKNPAGSGFMKVLAADVIVDVPKNAWLKSPDLNVEIAGKVNLKKTPAKPFTLLGSLNTLRGTYAFQGKLFKMTRGNVDFVGLEAPNPNLDIEAETRIKKVNIKLKISGTARNIVLSLDSDPPLEQSDIIAYLVFGRPVSELNNQQGFSAEQAALNITSRMAVNELKNILGDAFLLDTLTLEPGGEDVREGAVSAGKYISPDVFVLYRYRFKADEPDQVEITYELNRNFSIETQLGDEKSSGIDFVWEFDF